MDTYKPHKNSPPHWFVSEAIYMVTGSTLYKQPFLDSDEKRANFCQTLIERASIMGWVLQAWSVMPTHYHFIGESPQNALSLKSLIQGIHSINAKFVNKIDNTPGRKVWYNYWDTCIKTEKAYYARLNYVMTNPVKHGLVEKPEDYPFSSYKYFLENTETDFRDMIFSMSIEDVQVPET